MLRWMLRVDSWLDVASLENVEEDHSFLFPKKNLMKNFFFGIWKTWIFQRNWKFWNFFFFWKNLETLNFSRNWKFWLMIFFFWKIWKSWIFSMNLKILIVDFFFFWNQPKKYEPNAPSPKAFFENFLLFFFWKIYKELIFFFFLLKYEDLFIIKKWRRWRWRWSKSDEDFFFEKPILWMRITLAGSWCGLLDKYLLNTCKKIISISNGFIHWNELEVLTQCP